MQKLFVAVLLLIAFKLGAQENTKTSRAFSVEEAISYGLKNNYEYKNAQTDVLIAKQVVKETTAIGLPQINAKLSNTNYIDIPTTLMPDFISPIVFGVNQDAFGLVPITAAPDANATFPVKFGTKYNASGELSVSQLLFSGEYLIGLKASKTYRDQADQMLIKTELGLRENISKSYFLVLSLREQKQILVSTLASNKQLLTETKALFKNGFVEDTDVSQLEIVINNLKINTVNLDNQIAIALDYLKMNIGMNPNEDIELTDKLNDLLESSLLNPNRNFALDHNIDFQMMETQLALANLQVKRESSTYLPQLSAFFNAQSNAMRGKYNFFSSSEVWFPTTVWGFNLSLPIWSSGSRASKVQQAKLGRLKLEESKKQLSSSLRIEVKTAENNFQLHQNEYQNSVKNLDLSKSIYEKTKTKYKEGLIDSFELIQAHNNFLTASGSYTSSIFNVLNDRVALNRLYARSNDETLKQ